MYCPECGGEFRSDITQCPDCEVTLTPTPPSEDHSQDMVRVYRSADAALLPVLRSVLDASGIPSIVQGGEAAGLFPLGSAGGGEDNRYLGAVVLVPADHADEARELLQSYDEEGSEDE